MKKLTGFLIKYRDDIINITRLLVLISSIIIMYTAVYYIVIRPTFLQISYFHNWNYHGKE
jgi:hypothetical protein